MLVSHCIDLLLCERCALCGDLLTCDREWDYPLCGACIAQLPERDTARCSICSTGLVSEKNVCTRCREREYAFVSNFSLFLYEGKVRELIHQFKSNNCRSLASFFASEMAGVIRRRYGDFTVVPVPFRKSRKRARGWDHMEVTCGVLKKRYGFETAFLLKRTGSSAQKTLDYRGRLANLAGNIHIKKRKAVPEKVLLIDDVFTTGATADACASVLLAAGTREVRVLTVALDQ